MPGNIVIKPIEANLTHKATLASMSTYYVVNLGDARQKGKVCKKGGKVPTWSDGVTFEKTTEPVCVVELKAKRALLPDKTLGTCKIPVEELSEVKTSKWYEIMKKNKIAGQILIEANLASEAEQNIQPLASQSANTLEEKGREPLAEQKERAAVSLDTIPAKEESAVIKEKSVEANAIEPTAEKQEAVQPLVEVPVVSQQREGFVGVGEDFKHVDNLEEAKEMGHGGNEVKVSKQDNIFEDSHIDIPEERTAEEGQMARLG